MDNVKLRELLVSLQGKFEQTAMPAGDKLRALHTLSAMADHVDLGTTKTPHARAQAARLFEFVRAVPAAYGLAQHYPELFESTQDSQR